MLRTRIATGTLAFLCTIFCSLTPASHALAQGVENASSQSSDASGIAGVRLPGSNGTREATTDIMQRQARTPPPSGLRPEHELEYPERDNLPQNPDSAALARFPAATPQESVALQSRNIHSTSSSFDGATLADTGAFPPDSMGTVGPAQFIVFVNGRMRSFTKGGVADGVLNANPDVFFSSVMTPVGGAVLFNFTSDPQIRYDRFTARWYMSIIDVPCTNATCTTTAPNRWLLAVSDAASAGTISGSTVWTFFQFQADPGTNFCDYPSLGVDVNALYVGCNMFNSTGTTLVGTNGYVVQKASILGAGPIVVTMFANMVAGTGAGPESPRGVDNFDPGATQGYFVGPDNATFGTIMFRRVSNPGSLTPVISGNISVTVPSTTTPNRVEHAGNTGGANGNLASIDDRFFQAMIRNGHLWAAHHFRVNGGGVANTGTPGRNAIRWYEFQNLGATPTLLQSGTVHDSIGLRANALQYWFPSITVSGQDHAVVGFSLAGTPSGATPAYTGRLATDALGTMAGVPGTGVVKFGTTTANYNPASDPGGANGRRWGDYSFTVVDPIDDMSIWTIQEYNQALNSYAVRVGHLLAPPPATPTCSGAPILFGNGTGNVVINATSSAGSGFYDPGANLPAPALPFSHISATVTNATVNSVTYNSPTQVTLNITASTAGLQDVTLTNPDGQATTANGCINVIGPAAMLKFTTQPANGIAGQTLSAVAVSVEDSAGNVETNDNSTQVTLALSSNTLNGTLTQTAVNGVATFANLSINMAGTGYTLNASSNPALTQDTSTAFDIVANVASQLAFAQQPSDSTAGVAISPAITVRVLDQFGNLVATDTSAVTLAIGSNPGGSTLSGTATQNAVAGIATFNDLSLDKAGSGYTLAASDGVLTGTGSNTFTINPAAAASIAFGVQPSDTTAGVAISPAVTVQLFDAFGNAASNDNSSQVGIGVASGPGTLSGGGAVTVSNGVATFPNLVLTSAGSYTLGATSGVLSATSSAFLVVAASGNQLVFLQQPSDTTAGQSMSPAVMVQLQDQFGNALTTSGASVTLSANGPGPIVSGGSANMFGGIATFNAIVIQAAGGYSVTASSAGVTPANSNLFLISAAAATQLAYAQQPGNGVAGQAIAPPISVLVEDAFGNTVTSSNAPVALALNANPGGATLSGGAASAAVNGVATFAAVSLDKAGSGYTLDAGSAGLATATSTAFDIGAGAASQLVYTAQPASNADIAAGASIDVVVQVQDANGNLVSTDTSTVSITIGSNPGGSTLGGTASANALGGVATINGLSLNKTGAGYTLLAGDGGVGAATSNAFNIVPAAASQLAFVQQPSNVAAGASIAPAVTVAVRDAFGNRVASSANDVTLAVASGPGTLSGGGPVTDSAGLSTFNALSLQKAGSYTLGASSAGLAPATSTSFVVSAAALDHLAFTTQPPASVTAGSGFGVAAELRDSFDNVLVADTGSTVTLALGANPGGDSYGGASTTDNAGVANFNGVALVKAATGYTLVATAAGKTGTSTAFDVVPAALDHLVVSTQPPVTATAGVSFNVAAQLRDQFNNVLTNDNTSSVSVALSANPGSDAYAGGSALVTAGVASFSATLTKPANGYQLGFSSGAATAQSNTFAVVPNTGLLLAFVQQPADVLQGNALGTVTVEERDAFGNRVTADSSTSVALTLTACGAPLTLRNSTLASGLATFAAPASSFHFYTLASGLQLQASGGSLGTATSQNFNVISNSDLAFADGFESCRP